MNLELLNRKRVRRTGLFGIIILIGGLTVVAQPKQDFKLVNVDSGWAANSINTVVFRKNSLVSFKDTQFIAFYNKDRYVVVGKRKLGSEKWELRQTQYQGKTTDAHNCISIMV